MRIVSCFFLSIFLMLSACTKNSNPPPYANAKLKDDVRTCKNDASDMTDGPQNSSNIHWKSYFVMCMKTRFGYSNDDLRKIWY